MFSHVDAEPSERIAMAAWLLPALLLQLALAPPCLAVQLGDLVRKPSYFGAYTFRVFPDGTLLASAFSGLRNVKQLKVNKIVSVPNPPPDKDLESTVLLARIHPNTTVIWATAITTMSINVGIAIDTRDNVYAAASPNFNLDRPPGTVHIIKHDPNGKRIYEVFDTPPPRDPKEENSEPLFDIDESSFQREDGLAFVPPDTLVVGAQLFKKAFDFDGLPALSTFSAKSGKFKRVQAARFPPGMKSSTFFSTSNVAVAKTKRGTLACYIFDGARSVFRAPDKLFARCTFLRKGPLVQRPLTRELDISPDNDGFFYFATVELEKDPPKSRLPSFFVAYERVDDHGKGVNELVMRRLDSETLEDVDWKTGKRSAKARPIVLSLPRPNPIGNSHTSFHYRLMYSRKTGSVVMFLDLSWSVAKFIPEPKKGGKIKLVGDSTPGARRQNWLFFFDQERRLTPQLLDIQEGFSPDVSGFSPDEKCIYLYGFLSGFPVTLRSVSSAVTCPKGGCC